MTAYFAVTGYLGLLALILYFVGVSMPIALALVALIYLVLNIQVVGAVVDVIKSVLARDKLLTVGTFLLFSSIMLWRARLGSEFEASPVDTVASFRILQIALVLLIGIIRFRKRSLDYLFTGLLTFMLIYSCVGVLSTLYSSAPFYTLYKSGEALIAVVFVASVLGACDTLEDFVRFFMVVLGVFVLIEITIWIGILVWPDMALKVGKGLFGRQLRGVLPVINPNKVGFISALLILSSSFGFIASTIKRDKILFATLALFTLPIFLLAQSRTSVVGVSFAVLAFLLLNKRIKLVIVVCSVAGVLFAWDTFSGLIIGYMVKGENPVMLQTLTGRTLAWEHAWEMFKRSPLLGYGFASGARFDVLGGSSMIGLHGSIFDVLVNLGLIGVIPWLCAILGTWILLLRTFFKYSKRMIPRVRLFHAFLVSILILLTFRSVTATALVVHDMEFVLFLFIVGYAQFSARRHGFTDGVLTSSR